MGAGEVKLKAEKYAQAKALSYGGEVLICRSLLAGDTLDYRLQAGSYN